MEARCAPSVLEHPLRQQEETQEVQEEAQQKQPPKPSPNKQRQSTLHWEKFPDRPADPQKHDYFEFLNSIKAMESCGIISAATRRRSMVNKENCFCTRQGEEQSFGASYHLNFINC